MVLCVISVDDFKADAPMCVMKEADSTMTDEWFIKFINLFEEIGVFYKSTSFNKNLPTFPAALCEGSSLKIRVATRSVTVGRKTGHQSQ